MAAPSDPAVIWKVSGLCESLLHTKSEADKTYTVMTHPRTPWIILQASGRTAQNVLSTVEIQIRKCERV